MRRQCSFGYDYFVSRLLPCSRLPGNRFGQRHGVHRYLFLSAGFASMYNRRMTRLPKRTFRRALPAIVLAVLAYASNAQASPDRLKQVVQPYVDAQMFMGSVLVAKNGEVIFSKSYGMADLEWSVPNSSTTRFSTRITSGLPTIHSQVLAKPLFWP